MELSLSDEQEFFLDTTRRFLTAEAPIATVRALGDTVDGYTGPYWSQGCELGWTSMLVAETDGGGSFSEHGLFDLALIAEEFGRRVSPGPLVPANLVAAALSDAGNPAQKAELLGALLDGSAVGAWTGPTPVDMRNEGDGIRLTGTASNIEAGAQADVLLVTAGEPGALTLLAVPTTIEGIRIEPLGGLDLVRRFATIHFDDVVVPQAAVLGSVGGAAHTVRWLDQVASVLACAEAAGTADTCFAMTVEYLGDRYSFGRPLSSYQALKHRLADDKVTLESCHATVTAAVAAVAAGAADADELVSVAKVWTGSHVTELIQDCVQLHGGIGVTWEHDLHLYLRRATVNRMAGGTPAAHSERLAMTLLEGHR